MKTDTGGPAFLGAIPLWEESSKGYVMGKEGMTLLDAAALVAFREKLRIYSSDEDAAKHAYHASEKFVAEKRRREK